MTRGPRAWCALAAALALLALALAAAPHESLDWQPVLARSEPWRAFSAPFVHWSAWHLAANVAGCAVVAAFGAAARVPVRATLAWLIAWPLTQLALAIEPALAHYGGLSGVLHAAVAVTAWHLVVHEAGRARAIGAAVAAGLAIKLLLERPWAAPTQTIDGWDFPVAPLAHATGALAGLVSAAALDALARWRR